MYAQRGCDSPTICTTLRRAPRIAPQQAPVDYLRRNVSFSDRIRVPVLTLHTADDGLVTTSKERAYKLLARRHVHGDLVGQTSVDRAGHCLFTSAEAVTALQVLVTRLYTGHWPALTPGTPTPSLWAPPATSLGATSTTGVRPTPVALPAQRFLGSNPPWPTEELGWGSQSSPMQRMKSSNAYRPVAAPTSLMAARMSRS